MEFKLKHYALTQKVHSLHKFKIQKKEGKQKVKVNTKMVRESMIRTYQAEFSDKIPNFENMKPNKKKFKLKPIKKTPTSKKLQSLKQELAKELSNGLFTRSNLQTNQLQSTKGLAKYDC